MLPERSSSERRALSRDPLEPSRVFPLHTARIYMPRAEPAVSQSSQLFLMLALSRIIVDALVSL